MEDDCPRCEVCGEYAQRTLGIGGVLFLCNNVVCYHVAVKLIKETLEKAEGGECRKH